VGTLKGFDTDTMSDYFRGVFVTRIKTNIANAIIRSGQSVLEISTQLEALSLALKESLSVDIAEFGVVLSQFNIHSINVPEDDPAVKTLKAALAKRAEMGIVGFNYQQERSFDVLQAAAGNEGSAGTVIGAGIGLGMGAGIGGAVGQGFGQISNQIQVPTPAAAAAAPAAPAAPAMPMAERIQMLRELGELRSQGVLTDAEFETAKQSILAG